MFETAWALKMDRRVLRFSSSVTNRHLAAILPPDFFRDEPELSPLISSLSFHGLFYSAPCIIIFNKI